MVHKTLKFGLISTNMMPGYSDHQYLSISVLKFEVLENFRFFEILRPKIKYFVKICHKISEKVINQAYILYWITLESLCRIAKQE